MLLNEALFCRMKLFGECVCEIELYYNTLITTSVGNRIIPFHWVGWTCLPLSPRKTLKYIYIAIREMSWATRRAFAAPMRSPISPKANAKKANKILSTREFNEAIVAR